ncbi:putative reverse transcriptase domain-containing protein [Tanacetum coccineum]
MVSSCLSLTDCFLKGCARSNPSLPGVLWGFSQVLKGALDKVISTPDDISCWVNLLVLPLYLLKTFCPRSNIDCKSGIKRQRQEESIANAIPSWGILSGSLQLVREALAEPSPSWSNIDEENLDLGEQNIKQCKRKICDGLYTTAVKVLSSSGVAPYNDATLEELKAKHHLKPTPYLPHIPIDHHQLISSLVVVLNMIKSFPRGTSCGRDGLRAQYLIDCLSGVVFANSYELVSSITLVVNLFLDGKCPKMLGEYIASAPHTPLVKRVGGIRPTNFGVGVLGGGEAILHVVNWLIEDRGDDVGLSMLSVDFKNAFNLVDRDFMRLCYRRSYQGMQQGDPLGPLLFALVLHPLICKIRDSFNLSFQAWYLDDDTIIGDTLVVGEVLKIIMEDGPRRGLHLNVDKTEGFWPDEDPRSSELVMKSVAKSIELIDVITDINDSQYELLLLRACAGISKLYFAMRTCLPRVFKRAQLSFDAALRSALERIITASSPRFGDWQWRHFSLPFAFERLSVYYAAFGPAFDNALSDFNANMEIDLLSNPSEVAAPKLMKKLADIYFTRVTQTAESTFSLSARQMALWKSQMEDHTSDWLRVVLIAGLGHTINGRTYPCVLCYRLGVPLFFIPKSCSACSMVFAVDIYEDNVVSCAGIVGIKHRHTIMCDTLVDICFWSRILAGKEVDIGLGGGRDKPLSAADMLLHSWDEGLDVCVDLTCSSPLTQTGMIDFAPGQAVFEAAQRKRTKYEAKCTDIGYGFLSFTFSSFGELEKDAVTLLK